MNPAASCLDGLCRDCLATVPPASSACPACRSRRILFHTDLWSLSIAHLDCDAFFAAVEKRDNPALTDKPVIVGGGRRGVVATACYIARLSGVRSAMPMFKALKACPNAVVVKPDIARYAAVAQEIRTRMEALTPLVEPLSLDEAFLDLTGTERLHGAPPAALLAQLARDIEREVGISVSVGLAPNKFLAKLGSDLDKPRGFTVIGQAEAAGLLAERPVTAIFGVGAAQARALARDGITHIRHLQAADPDALWRRHGPWGRRLWTLGRGLDERPVRAGRAPKSVSGETTFETDLRTPEALRARLWTLCEKVSARSKEKGLAGTVITLKLKTADFATRTRRTTRTQATQLAHTLFEAAAPLLDAEADGTPFRLIGVGLSGLVDAALADQPDLLEPERNRRSEAERAMDRVRGKFGSAIIGTGRGLPLARRRGPDASGRG
ncbi:MAG: DNA polymerase IV [Alphaproteobacteria bacterium]